MLYLTTTRFNNDTWQQNCNWRRKNQWTGCIYGTPTKIKENVPLCSTIVILEMNNDINKIMGLGLVYNKLALDRKHCIYKWGNYNRFIYKSKYRIDRDDLDTESEKMLKILDHLVFKGSRHLKRGHGITSIPKWIIENKHINFKKKIRELFVKTFRNN